jgi:PAS domain S-box-containing protein
LNGRGLVALAMRTGEVVYAPDVTQNNDYVPSEASTQSEFVIPLKTANGIIGALDMQHAEKNAFSDRDRRILLAYAERAAPAIEIIQLYEELNRHAADLEWRVAQRTVELNHAKERAEAILNHSADGIILVNSNMIIEQTNLAFNEIFAAWDDAYFEQPFTELLIDEERERINQIIQAGNIDKKGQRLEIRALRKDGTIFDAELGIGFIKKSGLVCIIRDITERKRAEEVLKNALEKEKELSELKMRFISMASHEFRTPLATILATSETLSAYRSKLSENQIKEKLDKIGDQVNHLRTIIEDVLQVARLQDPKAKYEPVSLDLDNLCRSAIDEFDSRPDVTQQFVYSGDDNLQRARLDRKLIRQIINNLLSNAVKYSAPDTTINMTLGHTDKALILKVQDKGIGIPEADLKHLFEPFHRAANVGMISGTGLGLMIAKESVELHRGLMTVESKVGVGTTVTIMIPLE